MTYTDKIPTEAQAYGTAMVQLIIGPFTNPITGVATDYIYPAIDDIKVEVEKDNAPIQLDAYIIPFNQGTYKYVINTYRLMPGTYTFTASATFADAVTFINGHFELMKCDTLTYFMWKVRYMLFDWITAKYHLDYWKEGLKFNPTQLQTALETALGQINGEGGRDLGYTFDSLPFKFFGTLMTGAMYHCLLWRSVYEVAERHDYSDEVTLNINRDYSMAITNMKAEYDRMLENVRKQRPRPVALKSPLMFNTYMSFILSLPISVYSFAYNA